MTQEGEAIKGIRLYIMLETLISSKTRIRLLVRLFLNPSSTAYLRGLAEEFKESTNAIRIELNRFEDAGMLVSKVEGNKKMYSANQTHPLFRDINNLLLKYLGIDRIIDSVIKKAGDIFKVFLTGDYAVGRDSEIIDLIIVGDVNKNYLSAIVSKMESLIGKKIKYLTYKRSEWEAIDPSKENNQKNLLLWESGISGTSGGL